MYRAFYEGLSSLSWLPQATMIFFFTFFIAVLLRTYVLKQRKDFDEVASLPLDDEEAKS